MKRRAFIVAVGERRPPGVGRSRAVRNLPGVNPATFFRKPSLPEIQIATAFCFGRDMVSGLTHCGPVEEQRAPAARNIGSRRQHWAVNLTARSSPAFPDPLNRKAREDFIMAVVHRQSEQAFQARPLLRKRTAATLFSTPPRLSVEESAKLYCVADQRGWLDCCVAPRRPRSARRG